MKKIKSKTLVCKSFKSKEMKSPKITIEIWHPTVKLEVLTIIKMKMLLWQYI